LHYKFKGQVREFPFTADSSTGVLLPDPLLHTFVLVLQSNEHARYTAVLAKVKAAMPTEKRERLTTVHCCHHLPLFKTATNL